MDSSLRSNILNLNSETERKTITILLLLWTKEKLLVNYVKSIKKSNIFFGGMMQLSLVLLAIIIKNPLNYLWKPNSNQMGSFFTMNLELTRINPR